MSFNLVIAFIAIFGVGFYAGIQYTKSQLSKKDKKSQNDLTHKP